MHIGHHALHMHTLRSVDKGGQPYKRKKEKPADNCAFDAVWPLKMPQSVFSQTPRVFLMNFPAIDYVARRQRVMDRIGNDAVLVLFSNAEKQRSNDTLYPYRQNSDLWYLSGFEEPETVLVLAPGAEHPFVLFVRPRDREKEVWTGYRAGVEGAQSRYGADAAYELSELDTELPKLIAGRKILYHALGQSTANDAKILGWCQGLKGTRLKKDMSPDMIACPHKILHTLRLVKDAGELERMRIAAEISAEGHLEVMRQARPDQYEYELEAILTHTFRKRGAYEHAYEPIVAGGARACVLHYNENNQPIRAGELVLIDAGAEWGGYAGDITRTWPISDRFEGEQRAVYDAVLDAQIFAIEQSVAGASNLGVHDATVARLTQNMIDIGLLQTSLDQALETKSYREYYMHGTGHYLGIDVHDVGPYRDENDEPLTYTEGMVVTIEPGLYVRSDSDAPERFHGIGVRIEDDVVILDPEKAAQDPTRILTRDVPKDTDEILALRREILRK